MFANTLRTHSRLATRIALPGTRSITSSVAFRTEVPKNMSFPEFTALNGAPRLVPEDALSDAGNVPYRGFVSSSDSFTEESTKKRRRGEVEQLSDSQLEAALDEAILSKDTAELAVTNLVDRYNLDLVALSARLENLNLRRRVAHSDRGALAESLNIPFSKVEYDQIAPFVGLQPRAGVLGAPTIEMHRARIPNALFKDIIGDIEITMKQYGPPPLYHESVAEMSRFFAPVRV